MTFALAAVCLALCASLVLDRTAGPIVGTMRPGQSVPLLAVASVAVSLATGIALTALVVASVAGLTSVAAEGHWSAAMIRTELPIPAWLGAATALAVVLLLARAVLRTATIGLSLVRADRLCRVMRAGGGPVVIVDDGSADAYTVAGIRGCVVISRRLLRELSADQRRVLTAHELSHLNRHHHLYLHAVDIAAAANPLLRSVSAAVRLGVERWADEEAAVGIGDRRLAGRALARVALMSSSLARLETVSRPGATAGPAPTLHLSNLQVSTRVTALLRPAPRDRIGQLGVAVLLAALVLAVGVASLAHIHETIESAAPFIGHLHTR